MPLAKKTWVAITLLAGYGSAIGIWGGQRVELAWLGDGSGMGLNRDVGGERGSQDIV